MLTKQDLKIVNSAANDKYRPNITAVNFKVVDQLNHNGGVFNSKYGYKLILVATDGYILTKKTIVLVDKPDFDEILIPANDIKNVLKLMTNKDYVEIIDRKFIIKDKTGNVINELKINLLENNYPKYETLIPTDDIIATLILNAGYLIEVLNQVDSQDSTITIELFNQSKGIKPLVIKSKKDTIETISLVMPLKSQRL